MKNKPTVSRIGKMPSHIIAISGIALLSACAVVPEHMQVDRGIKPAALDKDVRFRTTYYFRVVDYCNPGTTNTSSQLPFKIDSLYRFRMTGKANSLFNNVHFESGILSSAEIDPFGANVAFDKKHRQFYLKTQRETREDALRERQFEELDRIMAKYRELSGLIVKQQAAAKPEEAATGAKTQEQQTGQQAPSLPEALKTQLEKLILKQLEAISGVRASQPDELYVKLLYETQRLMAHLETALTADEANEQTTQQLEEIKKELDELKTRWEQPKTLERVASGLFPSSATTDCDSLRRGFQILGPEGWRPFNQDDRLLVAMTTDAQPLISTLKELSKRVLEGRAHPAALQLPLSEEYNRISLTELLLGPDPAPPEKTRERLEKALETFKNGSRP